jgi:hypothetical protein
MPASARTAILRPMAPDPARQTRDLIERLRELGRQAEADYLDQQLSLNAVERGLLFALRESCETILTAIEAIDPVTQTMIEMLRPEVESRLRQPDDNEEAR